MERISPTEMMRRFLTIAFFLIAILAVFPLYTRLKVVAAPIPPGVHLGGLDLSDLKDKEDIRAHLEGVYSQPIALDFAGKRLALRPQDVDFHLDVDQMVAEASRYLEGPQFIDIAVRYALGFDQQRRDVPARFMLDNEKLRAWLEQAAAENNTLPKSARAIAPPEPENEETRVGATAVMSDETLLDGSTIPMTDTIQTRTPVTQTAILDWEWLPGSSGYTLDVETSIPLVVAALSSSDRRNAKLATIETPPPPPSMDDLARVLDNQTMNFPGFAAIYVHDLVSDEEAIVDGEVAFSGMSTMKIGIAAAVMRKLANGIQADDPLSYEVGQWLDYALGESNNYAANLLLRWLGDGNVNAGVAAFTDFMTSLGFTSTYMQSGYDFETALPERPTPGNQQEEWDTDPDSNIQSTPIEMGRILSAIYECTQGNGVLVETYPDEITPDECWQILFYMTHDQFQEMVWGGLPDLTERWIVHKHGFAFESHSDVALIWGPKGPYVVSIFLFRRGWMDWETSNGTMKKLSRIIWNFFEFQNELESKPFPPAPELRPPPGYVPINHIVPALDE
jgi:hypothetical protein